MSEFSAYQRAKLLGIDKNEDHRKIIRDYLTNIAAKDDRRLKWIVEAASRFDVESNH